MEETATLPKRVPRILVTRLSHIGDCVLTLPLLNALRRALPNAFIGWAVEPPSHQLLSLHAGIDQIINVPKGWMKQPRNWLALRRELRSFEFDVSIDPQGITKSAVLGWLSGAKLRIGASGRWGRELSRRLNNCLIEPTSLHLVDRSLELLAALNIERPEVTFDLPAYPESLARMKSFTQTKGIADRFMIINPGASWPSKQWETDRFAAVARHAQKNHDVKSLVTWAGNDERELAQRIVSLSPCSSILAPKTNLRELAALCRLTTCFLGCDTGPLHIATAMGARCIGLYGTTRPEESGAYGWQHFAVQKWYQAGSCRQRRGADNQAMCDILADDVCQAVDRLFDPMGLAETRRKIA